MSRVLITGGCGFIGTNLVEFLLANTDWNINILDNLSYGKFEDVKKLEEYSSNRVSFFEGDIRLKEDVEKAMDGCEFVVNLAAQTGVIPSVEDPLEDADINVKGLISVLSVAKDMGVKKLVQASSAAPLGDQEMPLDENKVPRPASPYGASKLAGEGYCSAFASSHDLKCVVLRFSNAYGQKSYKKGSVIPLFIRNILRGEELVVYGDGEQTRDFVYAGDICKAIYLGLTTELKNNFELFQIGTGVETSINELVKLFQDNFGDKVVFKYAPARKGEIIKNYCSIAKARKLLGYEPKTDLATGLKNTIKTFE